MEQNANSSLDSEALLPQRLAPYEMLHALRNPRPLRLMLLVSTGNGDFDSFVFASKEKPNIHST